VTGLGVRRNAFGSWLVNECENRTISLRELGRRCDISQGSLSRWTKLYLPGEKPDLPSRKMVVKLANGLGYKSATIQAIVDQTWADFVGIKTSGSDMVTLSPEARLFAERFDQLPKVVRNALWRAAFGEERLGEND
jgi:transcriptional regulator with XRE-family HTH domain